MMATIFRIMGWIDQMTYVFTAFVTYVAGAALLCLIAYIARMVLTASYACGMFLR